MPLSLQAVIDACFELVGYQNLLDYSQPPQPPLGQEDWAWVESIRHYIDLIDERFCASRLEQDFWN